MGPRRTTGTRRTGFPWQCPRVLAWVLGDSTRTDVAEIIGPSGVSRVHVIEYVWFERMRTVRRYAYRFPAGGFYPFTELEPATPLRNTGADGPRRARARTLAGWLGPPHEGPRPVRTP